MNSIADIKLLHNLVNFSCQHAVLHLTVESLLLMSLLYSLCLTIILFRELVKGFILQLRQHLFYILI